MGMPDLQSIDLARALTHEAIELCEAAGAHVAACHLQLAIDRLESDHIPNRVKEIRKDWTVPESFKENPQP